ncbi:MAG: hypothetical protein M3009_03170 [Bombella apis]|uniref:hypothetical protein n=1 Tax=Bombella apis TaxID=1785988 RepID=UPI0023F2A987|nr:hypothetical protein [Bombella apis]MCT6819459.1 hypothetical protein [Bombella apis]
MFNELKEKNISYISETVNNDIIKTDPRFYTEGFNDEGFFYFTCIHGHENLTILQNSKFEILSQMALYSLAKGFYRESIFSFSTCLERLFEYFIRFYAHKNSIDEKQIEKSWKNVRNQSERQIGAFVFMYLLQKKETPLLLDTNITKIRNDAVHKGKFPTKEEAMVFAEKVIKVAHPIMDSMVNDGININSPPSSDFTERLKKAIERHKKIRPTFIGISTLLSLNNYRTQYNIFTDTRNELERRMKHMLTYGR